MASKKEIGRVTDLLYWILWRHLPAHTLEDVVRDAKERKYSNETTPLQVYSRELAEDLLGDDD